MDIKQEIKEENEEDYSEAEKRRRAIMNEDIFCDLPDDKSSTYANLDNAVKKAAEHRALVDAYDDPEGYYNFQIGINLILNILNTFIVYNIGEIVDNRYEVFASKGKGVFSTVLRARDRGMKSEDGKHPEVAIKIIRANDLMRRSGLNEERVLKKLAETDPNNKKHCVRLIRSFNYRGHLCLVFENMVNI